MKTRNAGMLGLVVAAGFGVASVQAAAVDAKANAPEIQIEMKQFDANGDGFLSLEEFKAKKGADDLAFNAADINGDGRLSADEYAKYLAAAREEAANKPAGVSPAAPSASPSASPANPPPKSYSY